MTITSNPAPVRHQTAAPARAAKPKEAASVAVLIALPIHQAILLAALIAGSWSSLLAADPMPLLGDKDFHPSTERPVGEFGDGTANYPGAKGVVTEWDHRTGRNILWKCRMPNRSNSSAIVVGKKVFVGSEPDELVCVDADSGQILWKTSVMIDQFIPETDRAAVRTALGQVEDQALALDIPAEVAGQWVGAIAPLVDPAVSQTAQRIAEIRNQVAATGTRISSAHTKLPANLIVSKESADMLAKHQLLTRQAGSKPEDDVYNRAGIGWHAHIGFTMPTPVSDGKHVWYKTALGAMACLDLDGKVVWNKRIPTRGGTALQTFHGCGSPLLIGDRLFYQTLGHNLICVEKTTGKELWSWTYNFKTDGPGAQDRGHTSPSHLRLNGRDLIQTGIGPILDPVTGKVLERTGFRPAGHSPTRGIMIRDDVVIQRTSRGLVGLRYQLQGDKVNVVALWVGAENSNIGFTLPVFFGNFLYSFKAQEAATVGGPSAQLFALRLDGNPPAANGQPPEPAIYTIPWPQNVPAAWTIPMADAKGKKDKIPDGYYYATPAIADGHFFYGHDALGVTAVKLAGENSTVIAQNFMDLGIRSTPFFQGNRMYVRSQHYLYCIGPAPALKPTTRTRKKVTP